MRIKCTWSLCERDNETTATLTFTSSKMKRNVLKDRNASLPAYEVDDIFHGLTILLSVGEPDIE